MLQEQGLRFCFCFPGVEQELQIAGSPSALPQTVSISEEGAVAQSGSLACVCCPEDTSLHSLTPVASGACVSSSTGQRQRNSSSRAVTAGLGTEGADTTAPLPGFP